MRRFGLVILLGSLGCPSPREVAPDAGALDQVPLVVDAGAEPFKLRVQATAPVGDGGSDLADSSEAMDFESDLEERPIIPPVQELVITTNAPIRDWRLRVFDESDRVVISDDSFEETDRGIRYQVRFAEPLKTGYRYAIVLDAQTGASVLDSRGQPMPDLRVEFQIEGEKQKPPAPTKKPKPKKKR